MIYEEPIYRPLGDCMLGVEFGDEANLELNFKVLELERLVKEAGIPGIIETVPSLRELVLVIDGTKTTNARVQEAMDRVIPELRGGEDAAVTQLDAALLVRRSVVERARRALRGRQQPRNRRARERPDEGARLSSATRQGEFWVVCVGFTPGCYFSAPLDPAMHLAAPKWKTPRDFTPARCLALAGFSTGAYPVASPGGYQLLGRLAVNIYEPHPRNAAFPADGVLLRAGDRIRYRNVGALEYDRIWSDVEAGRYEYEVIEEEFDVAGYVAEFGRIAPDTA